MGAARRSPAVAFIKYWLPVTIYAILIFYISSKPGDQIPSVFPLQDILAHIIEYTFFALLLNRAMKYSYAGLPYRGRIFWVCLIAVIYALSDEFHQSFVPGRDASLFDLAWDSMGIAIANTIYR